MGALSNFAVAELRTGKPSTVRIMRFHYAESHSLDTCLLFDPFSVVILGSRFSADSCYCSARVYGALASPFCIPDLSWGHVKPTISALERQRQLQAFMIEVYFHWSPFASELPLGLTALHLQWNSQASLEGSFNSGEHRCWSSDHKPQDPAACEWVPPSSDSCCTIGRSSRLRGRSAQSSQKGQYGRHLQQHDAWPLCTCKLFQVWPLALLVLPPVQDLSILGLCQRM